MVNKMVYETLKKIIGITERSAAPAAKIKTRTGQKFHPSLLTNTYEGNPSQLLGATLGQMSVAKQFHHQKNKNACRPSECINLDAVQVTASRYL